MQMFRAMVCSVLWLQGPEAGVLCVEHAGQGPIIVLYVGGDVADWFGGHGASGCGVDLEARGLVELPAVAGDDEYEPRIPGLQWHHACAGVHRAGLCVEIAFASKSAVHNRIGCSRVPVRFIAMIVSGVRPVFEMTMEPSWWLLPSLDISRVYRSGSNQENWGPDLSNCQLPVVNWTTAMMNAATVVAAASTLRPRSMRVKHVLRTGLHCPAPSFR